MVKIPPRNADREAGAPDTGYIAYLLYGPDGGAVRERADRLTEAVAGTLEDPFQIAMLDGPTLADDPARLSDEAAAISLGGGRRVVRVRGQPERAAKALTELLAAPVGDSLVVVEAGELAARAPLRRLFEDAGNAAAIACYPEEGRALTEFLNGALADLGLRAAPEALGYLSSALGEDRQQIRLQLRKLADYVGGASGSVAAEDVEACLDDQGEMSLDRVALAVADGAAAELDRDLQRALLAGTSPVAILRAVARHFLRIARGGQPYRRRCARGAGGRYPAPAGVLQAPRSVRGRGQPLVDRRRA